MYKTRKKNVLDNLVAEKRQGWITTGVYIKTEVETVIIEREREKERQLKFLLRFLHVGM